MLLENIKIATKFHHISVEKILVKKLKNLASESEYAQLLAQLFGFYNSIENKIHTLIDSSQIEDIAQRRHVINLQGDLTNLGSTYRSTENPYAKNIDTFSKAIGVLYVIEGSTLGGQIIAQMLKKQIPTLHDNHLSYFLSYADHTMSMWISFKAQVHKNLLDLDEHEAITAAATTFDALNEWLTTN